MDTAAIIEALEAERDRLDTAIGALKGSRYGKPRGKGRRRLSAAERRRISQGMKKRWAERKKKAA